jgi:hypothetical protein
MSCQLSALGNNKKPMADGRSKSALIVGSRVEVIYGEQGSEAEIASPVGAVPNSSLVEAVLSEGDTRLVV